MGTGPPAAAIGVPHPPGAGFRHGGVPVPVTLAEQIPPGEDTLVAKILVADDDVDIRELVEFKLTTMGHEIIAVGDGAAAVEACRADKPDLAVLDVMMPGVSGLDAMREIRADAALADLPVILLTARAQESDVETGFDSGADDYITKPFSPRELASRVEALLSR